MKYVYLVCLERNAREVGTLVLHGYESEDQANCEVDTLNDLWKGSQHYFVDKVNIF